MVIHHARGKLLKHHLCAVCMLPYVLIVVQCRIFYAHKDRVSNYDFDRADGVCQEMGSTLTPSNNQTILLNAVEQQKIIPSRSEFLKHYLLLRDGLILLDGIQKDRLIV